MSHDHIARLDKAIERIARGQKEVQAIIERQQKRLDDNAEVIEQARELLERRIR